MSRKVLIIKVESIRVNSNGDPADEVPGKDARNNAIIANLKYPRPGAPNITTTMPLNLTSGQELALNLDNFWESGLFKEDVLDETVLSIEVTDNDKIRKLDKFLARFVQAIMGAGLGMVTGGISNAIVGAVVNLPVAAIKGSYRIDKDNTLAVIGQASRALDISSIPETLELDLVAPKTIEKKYLGFKEPGSTQVVQKKKRLIKKGDVNGKIRLSLKVKNW